MDPDQTASGSVLFVIEASKAFQQMTKAEDSCCDWSLRVKIKKNNQFIRRAGILTTLHTPTERSDAKPLIEREKQFESLPLEISRS